MAIPTLSLKRKTHIMPTMTEIHLCTTTEAIPDPDTPVDRVSRQEKEHLEPGNSMDAQEKLAGTETAAESVPYTVFTKGQRLWIALLASTAAMVSPLSSYIYYPALVAVADDMGVSVSLINLTITSYLIVAGIAPSIMGDLADQGGRRPVYMVMWTLYIAANVGIALQRAYPALLVLRMLQSAGSSGQYPLSAALAFVLVTVVLTYGPRAYSRGLRGDL